MKKHTFPEPGCHSCPHYQLVGNVPWETRYCKGFKRKKAKRFRSSDPKIKAPRWCPRRISPPACRIYGFTDEQSAFMELVYRDCEQDGLHIDPLPHHYKLRMEISLGMTAKQFYGETQMEYLDNILPPEAAVKTGEIIEIDDGLQPYYFYVNGIASVTLLHFFRMRDLNE